MPFDANASMLDRVAALESAVDGGLGDGGANAALDKQLANIEEALRLTGVALKEQGKQLDDLNKRHADLYALVQKLAAPGAPKPAA